MNVRKFEDELNFLLAKYDYTETVMWMTPVEYNDVIEFCLTEPRKKDTVFLAISKNGEYKLFDAVGIFPQRIKGVIGMFLEQGAEEWFEGLFV